MNTCKHCEQIRREQQQILDDNPGGQYDGLYVDMKLIDPISRAIYAKGNDWMQIKVEPSCACQCHDIARFVGKLPAVAA